MELADVGEDGKGSDVASAAAAKPVYDIHITLDLTTGEFEVNANFSGVVLQLGMLEYALVVLKRADSIRQAQSRRLILPGPVVLPVKH
jgi:hypothetical protein